jgi:O-antigen ligase
MSGKMIEAGATFSGPIPPPPRRNAGQKPLFGAYAAVALFMFFYFARPEDVILSLGRIPFARISLFLALLAVVLSIKNIRKRFPKELCFLVLLNAQLFLSAALSPVWRGGALTVVLEFAKILIVVPIVVMTVNTMTRLRVMISIQAFSITMVVVIGILKGYSTGGRLTGSLAGNYSDPNDLAFMIAMAIPLALVLLLSYRNWIAKIVWMISVLVMIYALLRTGSRGGFLTLVVAVTVFLWQFAIRGHRRYFLALVPLGAFILWQSSSGLLAGRLRGTFDPKQDIAAAYDSARTRQELFWRSVNITEQHPFFGVGPGNFDIVSGQWHTTHNSLTLMSSEGGLPALILYVLILWCGFKNLIAAKRLAGGQTQASLIARMLVISLWSYAAGSLFLSVAYEFFPYIMVAYTTALLSMVRRSAAQLRKSERKGIELVESEVNIKVNESRIILDPL